jgi:hypothetical protein
MKLWIVLCVFLAGCASMEDLPPELTDLQVRAAEQQWADVYLKDPATAIYGQRSKPAPGYRKGPFFTAWESAWVWYTMINTKNGFGGYTGFRKFQFAYCGSGMVFGWDVHNGDSWSEPAAFWR